ncbi:DEKNAAC104667 [Brettanomyces naardenensis]|uniref:DEKNAAC104668 n=1 Tax=Brettanomyces naardenensis TaxID=13370 RepID=A0A448YR74_BRENA|nr:DEKNAAC104667 [Brettanomyces naardenensis]
MSEPMEADDYSRDRSRSPRRNDVRERSRSPARREYYPGYRGSADRGRRGARRGSGYRFRDSDRGFDRGFERGRGMHDFERSNHSYENSVFIGNLPYQSTWRDLKDCFREAGEIVRADVVSSHGVSRGMGTVEFASRDTAQKAIQMFNRTNFMGREIFVREDLPPPGRDEERGSRFQSRGRDAREPARSFRAPPPLPPVDGFEVFVGNLPYTTTNEEFQDMFKGSGDIKSAEIKIDRRGRSKGYGIIVYANQDDAHRTIDAYNGQDVGGRPIEVRSGRSSSTFGVPDAPAAQKPASKNTSFVEGVTGDGAPSSTLFVTNLPWETTQSDLYDLFGSITTVTKAEIQYDRLNRPSGNAVVQLATEDDAANALAQLDHYEYGNRELYLSYANRPASNGNSADQDTEMNDAAPEEQVDTVPQQQPAQPAQPVQEQQQPIVPEQQPVAQGAPVEAPPPATAEDVDHIEE